MQGIIPYFSENPIIYKLVLSFIILVTYIYLIRISNKLLFKTIKDNGIYYTTRKRLYYLHSIILLVIFILIWSESRLDLTIYVGFISAGIAIALREIFTNIVALLIIVIQKPFEVGDRVIVNDRAGDVIDQKIFHFVVMEVTTKTEGAQSTGKIVHIPNNYIFLHPIANANKGFAYIWNEIEIRLTLDSEWEDAKAQFETILNKHTQHITIEAQEKVHEASKKYLLHYQNLSPIVYITVKDGFIKLTMRYLTEPRNARITEDCIWQEILIYTKEGKGIKLA
ncbi:mechanosensitive ion channel domain-containing protein [Anaerobacillus isosaccharinicus]|uniref:Mechanosensitive ion channel n=1 Tax=Anaerobacillus isosaccharinicus TaxID=1532552 RepID=A0A1S2L915_9BACI|nr:mechanosensitive ion channel domain-containing protein [Anaerobacillus isosaccharinicus]MBA5584624.1 mechanosensitive ion channel [Anaerobacillus isosaccharinicus]QOY37000.1 mechanosensitive ion channel [Anaerobacillus isosaccharinicus]